MQIYARNNNEQLITADDAKKKEDYTCLECGTVVRVRGGLHRRKHFYHITADRICSQQGKSLVHLQVQCTIQELLPQGESSLERRFDEINRIADVCWESKKVIFEVQCSPISPEEIQQRNADYGGLGYQVVWVFHDHRYGKGRLSAAEKFLEGQLHYYTNIDVQGTGVIYDKIRGLDDLLPINVASVFFDKSQKMYFEGDLRDLFLRGELTEKQLEYLNKRSSGVSLVCALKGGFKTVQNIYLFFLRMILESACR